MLGVRRRTGGRQGPKEGRWGQRPNRCALRWANWGQVAHPNPLFLESPASPLPPVAWHGPLAGQGASKGGSSRGRGCPTWVQNFRTGRALRPKMAERLVESPGHSLVRTKQIQKPNSSSRPSHDQQITVLTCVSKLNFLQPWRQSPPGPISPELHKGSLLERLQAPHLLPWARTLDGSKVAPLGCRARKSGSLTH